MSEARPDERAKHATLERWAHDLRAGALASAAAIVAAWLVHIAFDGVPFPPYAIGDRLIRETPGDLATWAIETLGHRARSTLALSVVVGAAVAGSLLGRLPWWAQAIGVAAATVGACVLAPVRAGWGDIATVAGISGAAAALVRLAIADVERTRAVEMAGRRRVGVLGAGLLFTALAGGALLGRGVAEPEGPVPSDKRLDLGDDPGFPPVMGLTDRITTPNDLYVVDINLSRPELTIDGWSLKVHGQVRGEREYSFADLAAFGVAERVIHLHCISNIVAGRLMGNPVWNTVALSDVLDDAGLAAGAQGIVARGADGFHSTLSLAEVAEAYLAIGMAGELTPLAHGHPVRLLLPAHYGMRGVKWLTSIEVVTELPDGYWAERGWDAEARLRLGSRIDRPWGGEDVSGPFPVAGLAYGPDGVDAVEVSADGGATWTRAHLERPLDTFAWTRWQVVLELPPGEVELTVRALDRAGIQDQTPRGPHPSGASGYHRVRIDVV